MTHCESRPVECYADYLWFGGLCPFFRLHECMGWDSDVIEAVTVTYQGIAGEDRAYTFGESTRIGLGLSTQ